jgi:hypothetical protein
VSPTMPVSARAAAALILLLGPAAARSQEISGRPSPAPSPPAAGVRTVRIAANPKYRASGLHRVLLGPNYRKLWAQPIDVEVLDLRALGGGLTPTKKGGGKQTRSLRFEAKDGREFRVRSVDKDPEAALPPEYRDTFVVWVAQDQISAANPAGPLVTDRLEEALGLLQVPHKLVVIPDDPALGEFRKEFAGMLGLLEEVPRVKAPVTAGFEKVEKLYDWDEVWLRMVDESPDDRIDPRAYLRARLLDMFVGDWDRHQRQFSWARVPGQPLLQPVPEDRDQAFAKFDGALLAVARVGQSRFVNFEGKYPPPLGLNWAARLMDRRVLGELDRSAWDEAVRAVQEALDDRVLDEAVRRMPPEYVERIGTKMVEKLRQRRARLPELAQRYYAMLAREAEVWGTNQPEVADVVRNADGTVEVRLALAGDGGRAREPYIRRVFKPGETREVRIYLQGGDDRAVSHGRVDSPIEVRVIGDGGNDVVDDSEGEGTHFYDAEGHNQTIGGPGTADSDKPFVPEVDYVGDPLLDWGSQTGPVLWFSALPDVGVLAGLKIQKTVYGFRKYPYRSQQSIGAIYSTNLGAAMVQYEGDFLRTNSRKRTHVLLRASDIELIRFFGYGNETVAANVDEFYRSGQRQYLFQPRFRFGIEHVDVRVGPTVKFSHTQVRSDRFLSLARPYGVADFGQVGVGTTLLWDARNHARAATRGAMFKAEGNFYPAVWSATKPFGEVHGEAAAFLSPPMPLQPTLALRVAGRQVWGLYPVHEAAFIGGPDTVRGLAVQRYAGDAAAWGNAELRLRLFGVNVLVPEDLGVFGLVDVGRVFLEGEDSQLWHKGYGGGLWMSFLRRENTISVAAARAEGRTRVYFSAGFAF